MVNLACNEHDNNLLAITGDLARQLNSAVIGAAAYEMTDNLAVTAAGINGLSSPLELYESESRHAEARIAEAKGRFGAALAGKADPLLWRSSVSKQSATDWLAQTARAADIVITHPVADGCYAEMFRRVAPGDLIMTLGRPALLLPRGLKKLDLGTVLIAWRDTRECRLAVAAALPLLRLAGQVIVAEVVLPGLETAAQDNITDVCQWLSRHGIRAQARVVVTTGSDAQEISALAASCGCGLLVAGAYGHSRMREWVFGGVTLDLLLRPHCATLIAH